MKKVNSLLVAEAIYNVLQTVSINDSENLYTEVYSNGREQGYTIRGGKTEVSFAEHRNSDKIIVIIPGDIASLS